MELVNKKGMSLSAKVNIGLSVIIIIMGAIIFFTFRSDAGYTPEDTSLGELDQEQRDRIDRLEEAVSGFTSIYSELQQVKQSYEELEREREEDLRRREALEEIAGNLNYRLETTNRRASDGARRIEENTRLASDEITEILRLLEESGETEGSDN